MRISSLGLDLIKSFEGYQPKPYICPAGLRTIGYGHVIKANESFINLSEIEAEDLLLNDIGQFEKSLNKIIQHILLKQNQFDALISFIYNVGVNAFINSTMLRLIEEYCFVEAAEEFDRWIYSKGRVLPGLVARRRAEKLLFIG